MLGSARNTRTLTAHGHNTGEGDEAHKIFSSDEHELSQLTDATPVRETKYTRVFLVTNAAEPIAPVSWLVFILWTRQLKT
jgi:hypothetical protein